MLKRMHFVAAANRILLNIFGISEQLTLFRFAQF